MKIPKGAKTVPCIVCGEPTPMLGTELCDRCWELKERIERNPELARQILDALKHTTTQREQVQP